MAYTKRELQPADDNDDSLATTEFVQQELGDYLPLSGGALTGVLELTGTLGVFVSGSGVQNTAFAAKVTGDGGDRFKITKSGRIHWGDGGGTFDIQLQRAAPNLLNLGTDDQLGIGQDPIGNTHAARKGYVDNEIADSQDASVQIFTASGSFTKATYPDARAFKVIAVGAGGGAAGATADYHSGGGGGGGGYACSWFKPADLAASETVTIGSGGAGATGGTGSTGGASSFGTAVCAANGGTGGGAGSTGVVGAVGGAGVSGDILLTGGTAGRPTGSLSHNAGGSANGYGGVSARSYGHGGPMGVAGGNGEVGTVYGGGGGGGFRSTSVSRTGGTGAAGIVIVEIY